MRKIYIPVMMIVLYQSICDASDLKANEGINPSIDSTRDLTEEEEKRLAIGDKFDPKNPFDYDRVMTEEDYPRGAYSTKKANKDYRNITARARLEYDDKGRDKDVENDDELLRQTKTLLKLPEFERAENAINEARYRRTGNSYFNPKNEDFQKERLDREWTLFVEKFKDAFRLGDIKKLEYLKKHHPQHFVNLSDLGNPFLEYGEGLSNWNKMIEKAKINGQREKSATVIQDEWKMHKAKQYDKHYNEELRRRREIELNTITYGHQEDVTK